MPITPHMSYTLSFPTRIVKSAWANHSRDFKTRRVFSYSKTPQIVPSKKAVPSKEAVPPKKAPPSKPLLLPTDEVLSKAGYWEDNVIDGRFPINFRIYHPQTPTSRHSIIYVQPPPTHCFAALKVVPLLSYLTGTTIITVPPTVVAPFPQPIHNLLRIYDHFGAESTHSANIASPLAVIGAGISAPLAVSLAMTEEPIRAVGVWGGIFNLTEHAGEAASWNRELEKWEHYLCDIPAPATPRLGLGLSVPEFWALRAEYFPNPETWADSFASPHLFSRSPAFEFSRLSLREIWGHDALAQWASDYIEEEVTMMKAQNKCEEDDAVNIFPRKQSISSSPFPPTRRQEFTKMRIVLPGEGENDEIIKIQGKTFVEWLRRGLHHWYRNTKEMNSERAWEIAIGKFSTVEMEGWGEEVRDMGEWVMEIIRKGEADQHGNHSRIASRSHRAPV